MGRGSDDESLARAGEASIIKVWYDGMEIRNIFWYVSLRKSYICGNVKKEREEVSLWGVMKWI